MMDEVDARPAASASPAAEGATQSGPVQFILAHPSIGATHRPIALKIGPCSTRLQPFPLAQKDNHSLEGRNSMKSLSRFLIGMGLAALVLCHGVLAHAQDEALKKILGDIPTYQKYVQEIRGEEFKKDVPASFQSTEDFSKFVLKMLDEEIPPERLDGWSKALKMLGVLAQDYDLREGLMEFAVTQAGAYYDPDSKAFFVVMGDLPEALLRTMVVHELHHALQDQLFDLEGMLDRARKGENSDAESALSFLVEGEAT